MFQTSKLKQHRPSCPSARMSQAPRKLRFALYDEVFEIPHVDDLSNEEVENVWTSPRELKNIRNKAQDTASLIDNTPIFFNFGDSTGVCIRGLDQNTLSYYSRRDVKLKLVYDTVFKLQRYHGVQGVDVHGMIGELCTKFSAPSVATAIQFANIDAREANAE
jgi:hypothetical protein